MSAFLPNLPRHSLVWLANPPGAAPARLWWENDRPFVVCRRREGEELSLGFCLPDPRGGRPIPHPVAARFRDLGMIARPPLLSEAAVCFPSLASLTEPAARLTGSAMWEYLTRLPFTRPSSDYDIVWEGDPGEGMAFFRSAEARVKVDGEISLRGLGEVAWRELAGTSPMVLLKSESVRLVHRDALPGPPAPTSRPSVLADTAVAALLEELDLYPKPGLVSLHDSGSHTDMDHALMARSARTLRTPFEQVAANPGPFDTCLRPLGILAEQQMLAATGGVNTHRGAIFALGLLLAAAAQAGPEATPAAIRTTLLTAYARDLSDHGTASPHAPGTGARTEAARGFPSVFKIGLPHFRSLLADGIPRQPAALETLLTLIATSADTNLIRRGGSEGARHARQAAGAFLANGGVRSAGWFRRLQVLHQDFTTRRLSPGGAADLLAATLFLHGITSRT